MESHTMKSCS